MNINRAINIRERFYDLINLFSIMEEKHTRVSMLAKHIVANFLHETIHGYD